MLASYLVLLHVCGVEGKEDKFKPNCCPVDLWTIMATASLEVREVLRRKGDAVVCPELGTRWPTAATGSY